MLLLLGLAGCSDLDPTSSATKDPGPAPVGVSDLGWRLHEDVQSLVYVEWTQDAPAQVHVEYSFDPDEWRSSPSAAYEAGTHERLIVGIPFHQDADWRVVVEDDGTTVDGELIETGRIPDGLPRGELVIDEPDRQLPGAEYLLSSINEDNGGWVGGTYWTFIIDRKGRIVWANKTKGHHWTLFAQVAVTGDRLLLDEQTYWAEFGEGEDSTIHETWLDEEIQEIPTPGLHHEFVQLPDGTLVWGSQAHGGYEALVQKGPTQPDETVLWTCQEDWPGARSDCESNGLFYVEETDSFLYSFYTNSSVVEVDRATGTSLWWAGTLPGGYSFDPPDSQYFWQHGISYTDTDTLLVSSEYGDPTGTWLLEYEVDHANRALHLVWSDGAQAWAETNGQAWRLENGNTLHIVGSASVIREVDAAGEDVWRIDFDGTRLLGAGQFLTDLYPLLKPVDP
jgi:hypothetical protein